jgi:hypothetical protein
MSYVVYDNVANTNIGPFDDYETAEMFVLHASHSMLDEGECLSIEPVSEPTDWALDNGIYIDALV